jgi:hypothetical protein
VDGQYSCFNHLKRLLNKEDVEKVERIAFDLDASICCPRSSDKHGIFLAPWEGVKTLYLAMRPQEEIRGASVDDLDSVENEKQRTEFMFKELSMEQQGQFLKLYRGIPAWKEVSVDLSVEEALEFVRKETGKLYAGIYNGRDPVLLAEGFCENVCPVLVVGN